MGVLNMDLRDRLTRGFVAGVIAAIATNIYGFTSYALDLNTLRYPDWIGIVIFNHAPPFTSFQVILATLVHLVFGGIIGTIFVYLIPQVTSKNLLFKGWLFGFSVFIIIYSLDLVLQLEGLAVIPFKTTLSDFIGASIYGLVLAEVAKWLTNKLPVS